MNVEMEKEMQIVVQSPPSKVEVPDGWLVEQRPRPSNPNHIDRVRATLLFFSLPLILQHASSIQRLHSLNITIIREKKKICTVSI